MSRHTQKMEETHAALDIQDENIRQQNKWLNEFEEDQKKSQESLQNGFDLWHKSIKEEQDIQF